MRHKYIVHSLTNENDVEAGREYVKEYVSLMHYLEHLYEEKRSASE
jgi:hypothetical protein